MDIYSLGVVAFELWHPFSTGMERIHSLEALRDGKPLPQPWASQHPTQAALVQWLTAANPGERPSARELLASPLLPASLGDEQLRDMLRSMDEHPDVQETVLEHLFAARCFVSRVAVHSTAHHPCNHSVTSTQHTVDELPGAPSLRTPADLESEVRAAAANAAARHGAIPLSSIKVCTCCPSIILPSLLLFSGVRGPGIPLPAPSKPCCLVPSGCACPSSSGSPLRRGWRHRHTRHEGGSLLKPVCDDTRWVDDVF